MIEIQKFGSFIIWPFVFTFLMVAYTAKKIIKTQTFKIKIKFIQTWKVSIIIGVLLTLLFFLINKEYTFKEGLRYIISMAFTMFVMWDGLKKWFNLFKKRKE